jgi:hypothetical protein
MADINPAATVGEIPWLNQKVDIAGNMAKGAEAYGAMQAPHIARMDLADRQAQTAAFIAAENARSSDQNARADAARQMMPYNTQIAQANAENAVNAVKEHAQVIEARRAAGSMAGDESFPWGTPAATQKILGLGKDYPAFMADDSYKSLLLRNEGAQKAAEAAQYHRDKIGVDQDRVDAYKERTVLNDNTKRFIGSYAHEMEAGSKSLNAVANVLKELNQSGATATQIGAIKPQLEALAKDDTLNSWQRSNAMLQILAPLRTSDDPTQISPLDKIGLNHDFATSMDARKAEIDNEVKNPSSNEPLQNRIMGINARYDRRDAAIRDKYNPKQQSPQSAQTQGQNQPSFDTSEFDKLAGTTVGQPFYPNRMQVEGGSSMIIPTVVKTANEARSLPSGIIPTVVKTADEARSLPSGSVFILNGKKFKRD